MHTLFTTKHVTSIDASILADKIKTGQGPTLISPSDEFEIDIAGKKMPVICVSVDDKKARFIFKSCYDIGKMNSKLTNRTGYYGSEGRMHVLNCILAKIPQEWQDIMEPRKITDIIDGQPVSYSDKLWIPSATDIFGYFPSAWWDREKDSEQIPFFDNPRNRVRDVNSKEIVPYWLRSVDIVSDKNFCIADYSGEPSSYSSNGSIGFLVGFDI